MNKNEDFLLKGTQIRHQNYVAMSILTPNRIPMKPVENELYEKFYQTIKDIVKPEFKKMVESESLDVNDDTYKVFERLVRSLVRKEYIGLMEEPYVRYKDFYGIYIHGVFEKAEECAEHCEKAQRINKYNNAYKGDTCSWLPFDDNPDKAEEVVYGEKDLNDLMIANLKNQNEANELFERRRADAKMEALKQVALNKKKNKNKNKNKNDEEKEEDDKDVINAIAPFNEENNNNVINELEMELEKAKKELEELNETKKIVKEFDIGYKKSQDNK